MCNSRDVDDEFHYLLICPMFEENRGKFIAKYFYKKPSVFKVAGEMVTVLQIEYTVLTSWSKPTLKRYLPVILIFLTRLGPN